MANGPTQNTREANSRIDIGAEGHSAETRPRSIADCKNEIVSRVDLFVENFSGRSFTAELLDTHRTDFYIMLRTSVRTEELRKDLANVLKRQLNGVKRRLEDAGRAESDFDPSLEHKWAAYRFLVNVVDWAENDPYIPVLRDLIQRPEKLDPNSRIARDATRLSQSDISFSDVIPDDLTEPGSTF